MDRNEYREHLAGFVDSDDESADALEIEIAEDKLRRLPAVDPLQAALERYAELDRRAARAAQSSWEGTRDMLAAWGVKL